MRPSLPIRRDEGAALVVVMSVLALLLVIATPFVLQAKKDYRSSVTTSEEKRARRIAEAAVVFSRLELEQTHQGLEHAGRGNATPWWDDPSETRVDAHPDNLREFGGGSARYMGDPRGDMWSIEVRDEQAFLNADSASPFLWSGLLGRAALSKAHNASDTILQVDSTAGFPKENGTLEIGGRFISYRKTTADSFTGVKLEEAYPEGAFVLNKTAWDLALYSIRSARAQGGITKMPTITAIKEVALYGSQAIDESQLDAIIGPFTVVGAKDSVSGWLSAQSLVADVDPDSYTKENGQPVRVANPDFFNVGTVVRIADPGGAEYHVVRSVRRRGGEGVIYLADPISRLYTWRDANASARMRHAVNINGCSREVLLLLLDGLEYAGGSRRFSDPTARVSPELAANIADVLIKNRPIRGVEHLVELLSALQLTKEGRFTGSDYGITSDQVTVPGYAQVEMKPEHALAVVQNAINPNHRLLINSTMPMSFVSGDYFTVEAGSSINDAAGSELARHRVRETFRSAPGEELRFRLDSQADFEGPILSGRGARYIESHPNPVARFVNSSAKPEQRLLRYMLNFEDSGRRGIFPSSTEGDIRLQPARLYGGWAEHFDGDLDGIVARGVPGRGTGMRSEFIDPEGYSLLLGAFPLDLAVSGRSPGAGKAAGTVADARGLNPFVVEFFLKPTSWNGAGLFSAYGRDPALDKIEAWYESSDRSLRLKVHDIAMDDPRFNVESAMEVSWTPTGARLEDDTWYHLGFHVEGTKPGQISMHVDGFKRGKTKFTSTLSGSMNESADSFSVEDASDWPDEGAFLIGTEVVHAYRTNGSSFQVFTNPNGASLPGGRGVRGTTALSHQDGETVTLFGYSSVLKAYDPDTPSEVLGEGGASLESELRPFNYGALIGDKTDVIKLPMNLTLGVEVLDLPGVSELELRTFGGGDLGVEQESFQSGGGYAIIVAPEFPGTNELDQIDDLSQWNIVQMIRYDSRDDEKLLGVQAVADPLNPLLVEGDPLIGAAGGNPPMPGQGGLRFYSRTLRKIVTRNTSAGSNAPPLAFIFPISVELTGNEGYKAPEFNSNNSPQAEYLQVGNGMLIPDLQNFSSHQIEWIAYTGVDRATSSFVFNDKTRLGILCTQFSVYVGQALLGNLMMRPDPIPLGQTFGWRERADTAQFGWNDPSDSSHFHAAGVPAIPCFRVSLVGGNPLGFGDCVTLMRADNAAREQQFVSWAWNDWAALTSNVRTRVTQIALPAANQLNIANGDDVTDRRRYTRLVKFPSGELPLIDGKSDANIGQTAAQGSISGELDEVRMRTIAREQFTLWDESIAAYGGGVTVPDPYPLGVDADATEIPIVSSLWVPRLPNLFSSSNGFVTANWLPDGRQLDLTDPISVLQGDAGLVMIDDEIVAFREVDQSSSTGGYVLRDCERGFMNTEKKSHSFGARIVFLDFRAVSRLTQQMQPDDAEFAVENGQDFGLTDIGEKTGGTVLIDREMIHFSRIDQTILRMPRRQDLKNGEEIGIFRGRFGTTRGSHGQDAIVLDMPFRYWDRYAPNCDDPELSFYEFSVNQPRSFFKKLQWTTRFLKPHIGIELLCRFDPEVAWDTPPEKSGGRLLRYTSKPGQSQEQRNEVRLGVDGKGMEVRVFFTYEANAFDPDDLQANGWKETPQLLDLELRYLAAPWVLQREVLR